MREVSFSHNGCGDKGALKEAHLSGLTNPNFPGPRHAASHAANPALDQTASPCCIVASRSSAGIAEALMPPSREGGQCSAVGTPRRRPARALPAASALLPKRAGSPLPHPRSAVKSTPLQTQLATANSAQHRNLIRRDLHGQPVKPCLKALFHRCFWQGLPPPGSCWDREIGFSSIGKTLHDCFPNHPEDQLSLLRQARGIVLISPEQGTSSNTIERAVSQAGYLTRRERSFCTQRLI